MRQGLRNRLFFAEVHKRCSAQAYLCICQGSGPTKQAGNLPPRGQRYGAGAGRKRKIHFMFHPIKREKKLCRRWEKIKAKLP